MSTAEAPVAATRQPQELTTGQLAAAFDFSARRAVVTGASRGAGRAVATVLAAAGATVLACHSDEDLEAAHELAQALKETGGDHRVMRADVADPIGVAALVDVAREHLTRVDVLVICQGLDMTLTATALLTEAAVPLLGTAGSTVVTIGPTPNTPGLSVTQAAVAAGLTGLTRSLARQLGPTNVRVNLVAAGPVVATAPANVAAVVLFLASTQSDGVTGEAVVVDGGQ
jgi:3-oxoacyl-[acyl-carrier protein] reductase